MGRREEKRSQRLAAIEEAAVSRLLAEGYERCSIEGIAADAGIARGTFYLYFPDKRALFEHLCARLYGPLVAALESTNAALATTPDDRLVYLRMAQELAGHLQGVGPLARIHFQERRSAGPAGEVVDQWTRRIEELATEILAGARERGRMRPLEPRPVALAVVGAVERLVWAGLASGEPVDPFAIAGVLADVFWWGISPKS